MNYKYTHWLKIDFSNETIEGIEWRNLQEYKEKYPCNMEIYYYASNPLISKVIKLDCDQLYQDLDLDVNSLSDGSLIRLKSKPKNIEPYNKPIELFFERHIKDYKNFSFKEESEKEEI